MDKINFNKINQLLLENDSKKQSELASFIGMKTSNLSQALKGQRPFPMGHIFKVADFFNIKNAKELLVSYDETITDEENESTVKTA
jgi:transcriptional regulator with XRE-family HTH domain